jgi:KaiC/GvpD/RAD55 family RecA-like ATPase
MKSIEPQPNSSQIDRVKRSSGPMQPFAPIEAPIDAPPKTLPIEWAGDVEPILDGFWRIDDWLPNAGIAAIYGHPGSGKSFFAMHMAGCIAEGREWAGRHVEKGLVVYVVAEGQTGFRNRLTAMRESGQLSADTPFAFVPVPIDLQAEDGDTAALIETIKQAIAAAGVPAAIIVLDTLSKTFGAGKENTDDMVNYVNNCQRVASAFQCLTVIVHHRPKDSESRDLRGHSSLRGNIDTAILIEGSAIKIATTLKQKDGEDNQRVRFQLDRIVLGHDRRGKEVSTCLVSIVDAEQQAATLPPVERQKLQLKGHNKTAFRAIEEVIAKYGKEPPHDIPPDAIDRFKTHHAAPAGQVADRLEGEFFALVESDADKKADSAKRTARRTMTALKTAGILGSWGDWVWIN